MYVSNLTENAARNSLKQRAFIKQNILTTSIFINAAGFLRIAQDADYKEPKSRPGPNADFSDDPDPLDNTRVHPEDYDLARKMASDALELDEEDVVDEHPSWVISQLMKNADIERKLYELNWTTSPRALGRRETSIRGIH